MKVRKRKKKKEKKKKKQESVMDEWWHLRLRRENTTILCYGITNRLVGASMRATLLDGGTNQQAVI